MLAAIAIAGVSFSPGRADNTTFAAGYQTPDPTVDPCQVATNSGGGDIGALQSPDCTPTEETPPKTHTPTPEPSEEPTDVPATEPAATNTTAPPPPPAATSTPSGGAGAGGLQPPSTGSNGDAGADSLNWLLVAAGMALAIGGTGALAYGLRKN